MYESAALDVEGEVSRRGGDLVLQPKAVLGMGGALSRLEVETADGWEVVHLLVTPTDEAQDPTWFDPGDDEAVTAVGVSGALRVRLPPLAPGRYRIARDYVSVLEDERSSVTATVIITVA